MISFKSYITEARMAPLYHGTRATNFGEIWHNNLLKGGDQLFSKKVKVKLGGLTHVEPKRDFTKGISLTRNLGYARYWALENIGGGYGKVVIKLDQDALARNYNIQPYNFWAHRDNHAPDVPARTPDSHKASIKRNEYEEWVKGDIKNVRKYITDIYVTKEAREYFSSKSALEEYKYNILDSVKKAGIKIHDLV